MRQKHVATARYSPISSGAPLSPRPLNGRVVASLTIGIAILSGLTVFLALCQRDNSLLAAGRSISLSDEKALAAPRSAVSPTGAQPTPDEVTRVTVPTLLDHQQQPGAAPAASSIDPAAQTRPSEAVADESDAVIARSHTDLVALEKLGVRHYVEFALARSRRLQRVGPLFVAVWRIDPRRKVYDLSLISDSHRVERKHVGLYTPIRIASSDYARPIEFVVNSLDRDGISGYISEPKSPR